MANSTDFNGSEYPVDNAVGGQLNGAIELQTLDEADSGILHSYFVQLALRHRRLLITASVISLVATFILTAFVMHPKYQATAVIRPVGQNPNSIGGLLQSTGMMAQSLSGTGIDSDIGTNVHDPDELVTILNSYTFTTHVIQAENLGPKLKGGHSLFGWLPQLSFHKPEKSSPLWGSYLSISSRFDCQNSVRTGNITLTYMDKDEDFAKYLLNVFIDRLREQLRAHDIAYSRAAARSIEEEAAATTDPLVRDDLYELAARQIKKSKTAEANSDFAFNVLEKPYVPPIPVRPWVIIDTLFFAVAVPLFIYAILVASDWAPRLRAELAQAASESDKNPDSLAESRKPRRAPAPEEDRPYVG